MRRTGSPSTRDTGAPLHLAPQGGAISGEPLAVLIVEPDRALRHQLASVARPYGSVTIAGTAHEALAALQVASPDLIITELNLPDAEGIEFIARIHRAPNTHDVLIMVVTQRASVRDKIAAFQAGADDYLVKPVDMQQFTTRMLIVSRFRRVLRR